VNLKTPAEGETGVTMDTWRVLRGIHERKYIQHHGGAQVNESFGIRFDPYIGAGRKGSNSPWIRMKSSGQKEKGQRGELRKGAIIIHK